MYLQLLINKTDVLIEECKMIRSKALASVGEIVEVVTEYDGNYIGELKDTVYFGSVAVVKILACTKYPSQRTIMYRFNSFERWPFYYNSVHTLPVKNLTVYCDAIPEYYELMRTVFKDTFLIETEADRQIYERHKLHWEGK